MSRPFLLIDGYNLMHASGIARRTYGPGQLERCRLRLLRRLAGHLTDAQRERTTIVFDATAAPADLSRQTVFAGMTVRFAPPGQEADDTIEEIIAGHSAPRQLWLISSDHRLQRSIRKRRGAFLDSEDFIDEIERRGAAVSAQIDQGSSSDSIRETAQCADSDTEKWVRVFADVADSGDADHSISQADVAAIQEEVDRQESGPPQRAGKHHRRKGV